MAKPTKAKSKASGKTSAKGSARNIRKRDHEIELIGRGVWMHGARVLMCRSVKKGYLYLPGGHVEFGESAAWAVEREFLEECGQKVTAAELMLVTEGSFETGKRWHHEINLVFRCSARNINAAKKPPTVRSKEPEIAFEWIDLAAVVDLDVRPTSVRAWLAAGMGGGVEWVSEIA